MTIRHPTKIEGIAEARFVTPIEFARTKNLWWFLGAVSGIGLLLLVLITLHGGRLL